MILVHAIGILNLIHVILGNIYILYRIVTKSLHKFYSSGPARTKKNHFFTKKQHFPMKNNFFRETLQKPSKNLYQTDNTFLFKF